MKLAAHFSANWDSATAQRVTAAQLPSLPQVDGVWVSGAALGCDMLDVGVSETGGYDRTGAAGVGAVAAVSAAPIGVIHNVGEFDLAFHSTLTTRLSLRFLITCPYTQATPKTRRTTPL